MTTTSARMMTLCSHCGGARRKKLHPAHTYHCGTRVKLNGMKSSARDRSYPAVSAREVGLLQGRTLQRVRSVLPEGSGYDDIHMRAARKAQKTPWRPLASPMSIHRGRARPREGESTHSATHAGSQGEARVGAKGANIVAVVAPLATWRNGAPFATWRNGAPALTHAGAQRPRVVSSRAGARVEALEVCALARVATPRVSSPSPPRSRGSTLSEPRRSGGELQNQRTPHARMRRSNSI